MFCFFLPHYIWVKYLSFRQKEVFVYITIALLKKKGVLDQKIDWYLADDSKSAKHLYNVELFLVLKVELIIPPIGLTDL